MNELAKTMKVIRLKDEEYGQYLTASNDKVSVTLTKPDTRGWNPKNTEWRLQWLNGPKNLVGQVRLWSIYNKVLTFHGDPNDYYLKPLNNALTQESCPVAASAPSAEWRFELRSSNFDATLIGDLFKWSKQFNESMILNAKSPGIDNQSRLEFNSLCRKTPVRWLNFNSWLTEVVVSPSKLVEDEDDDSDDDDQYHNKRLVIPDMKFKTNVKPVMERQISDNETGGSRKGYFRDLFMSKLSKWQVGQIYLNMGTGTPGVNSSRGNNYSQYSNSGGNINGSGIQKNGDVSVYSEINRSRDNTANFINYK